MNNTEFYLDNDNMLCVKYHDTVILFFNDFSIEISCGKYPTKTTRKRLNQVSKDFKLGFEVICQQKNWFVIYKNETLGFYNGITLLRRE